MGTRSHDNDSELVRANRPVEPRLHKSDSVQEQAMLRLQRSAGNEGVNQLMSSGLDERALVERVIGSSGQPLEPSTRDEMESKFGSDFGGVRVHSDAEASRSAQLLRADAYTVGNDIVVRTDKYEPQTGSGRELLAHELTHVVQQRSGPVDAIEGPGGLKVSEPTDRFERAAESVAHDISNSGPPPVPTVQREQDDETLDSDSVQRQEASEEEPVDEEELKQKGLA